MAIKKVSSLKRPAEDIASFINQKIASGHKVLWLVTGGSSVELAVAVAKLVKPVDNRLTITLTDERSGPVGHKDSNWQQLKEAGFKVEGANLVPVLKSGLDLNQTGHEFAADLQKEFTASDIKIGLLGIGVDGHVAGILPHSAAALSNDWATVYEAPNFTRITTTFKTLRQLDRAWLYFEDPAKLPAVEGLDEDPPLDNEPAAILKQIPKLVVYYKTK